MYKIIIFDLGETLVSYKGLSLNWSDHYNNSLQYACDSLSIPYDGSMLMKASSILLKYNTRINPRKEEITAQTIFEEIIPSLNADICNCELLIEKYFEYFQRDSEVDDTAIELSNELKQRDIKTAVLTDVPYGMPKKLVMKDLEAVKDKINLVVTSADVGYRKPSTTGLERILKHFNLSKDETIYIGNEQKDILMANNFGIYSILICSENTAPS